MPKLNLGGTEAGRPLETAILRSRGASGMAGSRYLVGGLAMLCLGLASPAAAQRTGTRLDRNRGAVGSVSKLDADTAIRATNAFGRCIAQRDVVRARRALDLPFVSDDQIKLLQKGFETFDECLGTSPEFDTLQLPPVLLAGAAAEWFISANRRKIDLTSLSGMTDEALDKTEFKPRTDLEDFGLCLLRRNPANALAFVSTRPTSADEAAAVKALMPDIGPCVTVGQQVSLNVPNLRAVVAYAIYRAASKLGAIGA